VPRHLTVGKAVGKGAFVTAALYYRPDAYSVDGSIVRGRNVAGVSFLRGYLAHAAAREFWVRVDQREHADQFAAEARRAGRGEPVKGVDGKGQAMLAQPGALHLPGPSIGPFAWQRALASHRQWSLTGVTHTTASAGAMDAIAEFVTAPVQPWDALICTSEAVKQNVERLLDAQAAYLSARLGASRIEFPRLPVIPLGVHCDDFAFSPQARQAARARLGLGADALVVLYVGRLSFHAKAHPLAMYQSLERAARRLPGARLVLIECGWHAAEAIAKAFREAAALACPSVSVITLDGRKAADRETAWASADLFCSLSDNIQETFGLTPIEAMAAGLPAVVSDWDGYKDTVRHDIDGFRVPTLMPPAGHGEDIAIAYALDAVTYDRYCGTSCLMIAVDIEATTEALLRLLASPDLRRRMGDSARARAREIFDWAAIIPRYEALWAELAEARAAAADPPETRSRWPARMDPFRAFAGYATRTLTNDCRLALVDASVDVAAARVGSYRRLAMIGFADSTLPTAEELRTMLQVCAGGPLPAGDIIERVAANRRAYGLRWLAWLAKLGIVRVVE
jgi:alpha-maltose-1-phosphate synthase